MLQNFLVPNLQCEAWLYRIFSQLPRPLKVLCVDLRNRRNRIMRACLKAPFRLIWFITARCPGKCSFCLLRPHLNAGKELSLAECKKVIMSLSNRLSVVTITGGEPFTRGDIIDICCLLDQNNKKLTVSLPTAGFMPERIEESLRTLLQKTRLTLRVTVSLDGLASLHDSVRGYPGLFERATETIIRCIKLRRQFPRFQTLSILTTIGLENTKGLPDLIQYVKKYRGAFHKFQFVRSTATDVFGCDASFFSDFYITDCDKPIPSKQLIDLIKHELKQSDDRINADKECAVLDMIQKTQEERRKYVSCVAGSCEGVILPNGDVSTCEFIRPFADLRDFDFNFLRLWNDPQKKELCNGLKGCFCTHPCHILSGLLFGDTKADFLIGDARCAIS